MAQAKLILEGLSKVDKLSLETALKGNDTGISIEDLTPAKAINSTKSNELVSAFVIGFEITQLALSIFKVWYDKRHTKQVRTPIISVQKSDGTIIKIELPPEKESETTSNIDSANEIISKITEILKDIK
jgi:hypothetical protein